MAVSEIQTYAEIFVEELHRSNHAVVLTGAGVSTGSGIPDFRSTNGLYSKISANTFDLNFLYSQPAKYYETARKYIHVLADCEPNITHFMLAKLEEKGLIKAIITQNIDFLHQKSGSKNVIEFHGNVNYFHCDSCGKKYSRREVEEKIDTSETAVPNCQKCGNLIRPDIVFFGDPIPAEALTGSQLNAEKCDLFITMGSSLSVIPASSLPMIAKQNGSRLIIVNRDTTPMSRFADNSFLTDLTQFSEAIMKML